MYRFHFADPVYFESGLKVTMQALGWQTESRYLPLEDDPLFSDDGGPLLLPFLPPEGSSVGKGAAIVCPGGNY